MTTNTEFTSESIKQLEADILTALEAVERKHNVKFTLKSPKGYYANSTGVMSLIGEKPNWLREDYLSHGSKLGLDPEWVGQAFFSGSKSYVILGYNPQTNRVVAAHEKDNGDLGKKYAFEVGFIIGVKKYKGAV